MLLYTGETGTVVCKVSSGDGKPLPIWFAIVANASTEFMDDGSSLLVVRGIYDDAVIA